MALPDGRIVLTKPTPPNTELFMRYGGAFKLIEALTEEQACARRVAREEMARQREAARLAKEQEEVAAWAQQRAGPYTPTREARRAQRQRAWRQACRFWSTEEPDSIMAHA